MGRAYSRDDVETHAEHYRPARPAVNVKVRHFPGTDEIAERFGCNEKTAERAGQFAFEAACGIFWEDVEGTAKDVFGTAVRVWSEGRSGGWAVVDGLPDVEGWDAIQLGKWRRFETWCKKTVRWLTSKESVMETIESNRWAEKGSEAYNFIEKEDGESVCVVDLKKKARDAGLGAVVRG